MMDANSNALRVPATSPAIAALSPFVVADTETFKLPARGGLPPRALRRVREYVQAHLEEKISLQTLATMVGLSNSYFCRAFKQSTGLTPHQFLLRCRVRRVQELIATTELPLIRIALAAGFADQGHCSRRFHQLVGVTPSRYRWLTR